MVDFSKNQKQKIIIDTATSRANIEFRVQWTCNIKLLPVIYPSKLPSSKSGKGKVMMLHLLPNNVSVYVYST